MVLAAGALGWTGELWSVSREGADELWSGMYDGTRVLGSCEMEPGLDWRTVG